MNRPPVTAYLGGVERGSGSELYRRDRGEYLDAFWELEDGYKWSQPELDLVNAVGFWLGEDKVAGLPQIVGMGYLAGRMEAWRESLAEHRLSTLSAGVMEEEIAEHFGPKWDQSWPRIVSCIIDFRTKLEEFAFDQERLNERLAFLCDAACDLAFKGVLTDEQRVQWREFHRHGTATALYARWWEVMDELGVPEDERWTDELYARPTSDSLVNLELPTEINGCELSREDLVGGYDIRSKGPFGGGHWVRFRALGDTAEFILIVKEGRLGAQRMKAPIERHVDVLRTLGFQQMVWPDGKRYEIRTWPGVRRVRDSPQEERARLTLERTDHDIREAGVSDEGEADPNAERKAQLQDEAALSIVNDIVESVGARWDEVYAKDQNPTLSDTDLHQALVWLRELTAEHPNEGVTLSEDALNAIWSIGSAGYCWRVAEEQTRDGPDEEYRQEIERVMADLPDDPPREQVSRDRLLIWGAGQCADRGQTADFRVWHGCPVGFGVQFYFFETAFEQVAGGIVPAGVEVTTPDLLYAFIYGLALRDVERWLVQHPT